MVDGLVAPAGYVPVCREPTGRRAHGSRSAVRGAAGRCRRNSERSCELVGPIDASGHTRVCRRPKAVDALERQLRRPGPARARIPHRGHLHFRLRRKAVGRLPPTADGPPTPSPGADRSGHRIAPRSSAGRRLPLTWTTVVRRALGIRGGGRGARQWRRGVGNGRGPGRFRRGEWRRRAPPPSPSRGRTPRPPGQQSVQYARSGCDGGSRDRCYRPSPHPPRRKRCVTS